MRKTSEMLLIVFLNHNNHKTMNQEEIGRDDWKQLFDIDPSQDNWENIPTFPKNSNKTNHR
jgi:hypothetical protein